jgi:DNA-binding response OmpR family regulator
MERPCDVQETRLTRQRVEQGQFTGPCIGKIQPDCEWAQSVTLQPLRITVKTSSSIPPTLRFGVFEFDPRAGELRKKGMKIRLQGQPVDILAMLLEHRGEIVTRKELQRKLWPADT